MHTDELNYDLPDTLIAQYPADRRGDSRLMVLDAEDGIKSIGRFTDTLVDQLRPDDLVVANDTRVLHARIPVKRESGGAGEFLLLEPVSDAGVSSRWRAMARPARKYKAGMHVTTRLGETVKCIDRAADTVWIVEIPCGVNAVEEWLLEHGQVPLPPYIHLNGQPPDRYQTVFANEAGSVAAPTAGLHFDDALWSRIGKVCETATITLHVGAGTFLPIKEGELSNHVMHSETYSIDSKTDAQIRAAIQTDRRIVAIGTTSTRALESAYATNTPQLVGDTQLFITPGFAFRTVGALLTNFHLPKSTLIALVMAFAGENLTRSAYQHAIAESMRFYSFGDAMFIHGKAPKRVI